MSMRMCRKNDPLIFGSALSRRRVKRSADESARTRVRKVDCSRIGAVHRCRMEVKIRGDIR